MNTPDLPRPDLEDVDYELWGQNVKSDCWFEKKMRAYGDARAAAAVLAEREKSEAMRAALVELTANLGSCRGAVKTELHHYERLALVHGKTPHGEAYEAEAQRLSELLCRIDAIRAEPPKEQQP